jgi:hypothetical protein
MYELEEVLRLEKENLELFIFTTIEAYNIINKPRITSIEIVEYEQYHKALMIVYPRKKVYINVNANSNKSTARILVEYIYGINLKPQGFIKEVYS